MRFFDTKSAVMLLCSLMAILVLVSMPASYGQAPAGMAGTVSDQTGAVVPGAVVTLTNKTTGVISGSFANPDNTKQTIKFTGVILQGQTTAQGYFLGTNQSGTFTLEAP